MDKTAKKGKT